MKLLLDLMPSFFEFRLPLVAAILITLVSLYAGYLRFKAFSMHGKKLPPGSQGFPLIGETISFLKAQKQDKTAEWIKDRVEKYGPVFKTSLMGSQVVLMIGQAGNKFVFGKNDAIASNLILPSAILLGKQSLFEVEGGRHKLLRGAMMNFLKVENVQKLVVEMDSVVKQQVYKELKGKDMLHFVTLMKKLTFKVTCSLLFGLPEGRETDLLFEDFTIVLPGTWAIPLDIPGTIFWKACQARGRISKMFSNLIKTRKLEMEEGKTNFREDIVSNLINVRDEEGNPLSTEVIIDNLITLVIASHDTTAILLSLFVRYLSKDTNVYNKVLKEQAEAAKLGLESDSKLKWSKLQSMKYTWRVAQEIMRLTPPISGNFKTTIKDTSFGGFDIPKGWRVFWFAPATHVDETIFEEPEKFDPSRFESLSKSVLPYTYIPFGAGHRVCPGNEFARCEVLLIIHYLITNYLWTPMIPDEPITRDPMPYPAMGFPVKLQQRKNLSISTT